jgi:NADH-quinone oxidoreductase subunit G
MAKVTIDGTEYELPEGRSLLHALDDAGLLMNGVDIPHFCWHPKLPVDGSCRMCQVQVDDIPKLQIACDTMIRDGMVVQTKTPKVVAARRTVMELLLVNHPLDCPICDQAGECTLQDYAYEYGVDHCRSTDVRRPAKKAYPIGPRITFDQERCILCRRCVRFCREFPKTGELGVFRRADESLLEVFPGTELDNPYSMNVIDMCPVGALTSKDFRFKIRVWFLDDVRSVCNQCANGCNIWASRANNKVYRYVPRRNDAVNQTFMCDHGRLSYTTHHESRMSEAAIDGHGVPYDKAVAEAAQVIAEAREAGARIIGVASPFVPNEDLFVFKGFLEAIGAESGIFTVPMGEEDDLLIKAEKAPNAAGCRALGFSESSESLGEAAVAIALGSTTPADAFKGVERTILIDTHESKLAQRAHVQLPARSFGEREGTFTNHAGRVQRFQPFIEPSFEAWAEGEILHQIAARLELEGWEARYDVHEVSKRLAQEATAFSGIDLTTLDDQGSELK